MVLKIYFYVTHDWIIHLLNPYVSSGHFFLVAFSDRLPFITPASGWVPSSVYLPEHQILPI